jgi:Asp-tRNA(Asn)/Glu-tRNA(Gln) amidotransferase B subunit
MKIDLNTIHLVSPKQNASIVKMISDGTISGKQAKELLTIVMDMNVNQIEEFLSQHFDCPLAQR